MICSADMLTHHASCGLTVHDDDMMKTWNVCVLPVCHAVTESAGWWHAHTTSKHHLHACKMNLLPFNVDVREC
jgi:hypothetical protein